MTGHFLKHNPGFLDQNLRGEFVVRQAEHDAIVEIVSENTAGVNQHVLVIAGRGMGKTTLVRRVALSIQDDPALSEQWHPVVLPEESYTVSTAGELWVEVLGVLPGSGCADPERWREAYQRLRTERDEQRLREQALGRLGEFSRQTGRKLLVIVENLNFIFDDQADPDAGWSLRETLLNEPRIMLLATATAVFDEIERPDRALFELFREINLERLDTEECGVLWRHVNGEDLSPSRTRAVEILTGGNPRLLAMLAHFSAGRSFRDLLSNLTAVIDEYTPYFKACIESLPAQERRVFVVLADAWQPSLAREVAGPARLDVNKTSEYLGRLERRGAVERTGKTGRAHHYQVAERLFNIYHLFRRGGSAGERARATVEFMSRFYGPEEPAKWIAEECIAVPEALSTSPNSESGGKDQLGRLVTLSAEGHAALVLETLSPSPVAEQLEPLIVALRMIGGEEVRAPQEIVEVARDLVRRMEEEGRESSASG